MDDRQRSQSSHPQDKLQIIRKFLKPKPPSYDRVDPIVNPYQFLDQIKRIGKMVGFNNVILIMLVGYYLGDITYH